MVTFNSSVNLFIYCGFGKKFRREFKKLLGLKVDTELEVRFLTSHPDNKAERGIYFQFVSPHAPLYHSHGPNPPISRFFFLKVIVEKPSEKKRLNFRLSYFLQPLRLPALRCFVSIFPTLPALPTKDWRNVCSRISQFINKNVKTLRSVSFRPPSLRLRKSLLCSKERFYGSIGEGSKQLETKYWYSHLLIMITSIATEAKEEVVSPDRLPWSNSKLLVCSRLQIMMISFDA